METGEPTKPTTEMLRYERIHQMVAAEFPIEEGFIEYNTPTFYVTPQPNLKQAFLRLYKQLNSMKLVPILRKRENRITLQVIPKPPVKPSRPTTNIVLFLITIATLLITGYVLSLGWTETLLGQVIGAIMFTIAIMSILGVHEMSHKLTADRHNVESTYPYFIPGPPAPIGIGTFGAVIQQKSLAPNKDALFDLGMSGPIMGFLITIVVTVIGIQMSQLTPTPPPESIPVPVPLLFELLVAIFPPSGTGNILLLHPVAYAGFIGMVVTMLNLMPVGQLDGGHIAYVLVGETTRTAISILAIISLFFIAWPMALIAILLSRVRHPGPLDDVSKLSRGRKLAIVVVVLIFVLSVAPVSPLF